MIKSALLNCPSLSLCWLDWTIFALGNNGDLLIAVGIWLKFLVSDLVILAIAGGLFRVGQNLTSSKISKSEKKGTLRRLLIVLSLDRRNFCYRLKLSEYY